MRHNIVPNISIDCVVFGFDFEKLNVLLVERELKDTETGELLINDYTLAGYHIFEDENLDNAAARILKDVTGLENIFLEQFYTFGSPDRVSGTTDQLWIKHINEGFMERVISVGYFSLIDNTKVSLENSKRNVSWYPVKELNKVNFAFDHRFILHKALEAIRKKVRFDPVAFEMLPEKFTLSQLQKLYEVIYDITLDKRNFRKKILQLPFIVPLNEKQRGVAHKPAQLFTFSKEMYLQNNNGIIDNSTKIL